MKFWTTSIALMLLAFMAQAQFTSVDLTTGDRHEVKADLFEGAAGGQGVLLCHQAKYSRGEYRKIAPKLVEMGFTCLAIDQRSGGTVNGVENETYKRAKAKRMPTTYIYAEPDIVAGIEYLFEKTGKPVIVVGSSYSASLVMMLARRNPMVAKVVAFSPGEYYDHVNVSKSVAELTVPVFVSSTKSEAPGVKTLVSTMDQSLVTQFVPEDAGKHGAKALWTDNPSSAAYWEALTQFLK